MSVENTEVGSWYLADTSGALAYEAPEKAGAAVLRTTVGKIDIGTAGSNKLKGTALDDFLSGKGGSDVLSGGDGKDVLDGGDGNDIISGGAGTDLIVGGAGNDRLKGGSGIDMFFFDTPLHNTKNVDRISDFAPTVDVMALDNAIFKKVGAAVASLNPDAFWAGRKAHDASDRIIYNKGTGALYYDPDGTGAKAQIKFAQLKASLALSSDDFQIV